MKLGSIQSASILVVDDEESIVRLVVRALQGAGYASVTGITNAADAVSLLKEGDLDLVILDIRMPEMDGYEVMRTLAAARSDDTYLPVLAMSAMGDIESKKAAMSLGAKDFLVKPFSVQELLVRVQALLETRLLNVTLARHRDKLEELVTERTKQLEQSYAEMLERLSRLAELRDDATTLHTVRVANLCRSIARELGISPEKANLIAQAAPLHDLGKVAMRDAILLKPGPLAADERAAMQEHAALGASVLRGGQSRLVRLAESVARYHHEWWDGTGYPEGLKGESIPVEARIVSVADAYDAMVNERPYSAARSSAEAVEEIRRQAGKQFDPKVVEALVRVLERHEGSRSQLR